MLNSFISAIGRESLATSLTFNGANTYISTGNANLDLFSLAGGMRGKLEQVLYLFDKAFNENPEIALKNIFYIRDVRGGQGERDMFRVCMGYLVATKPELISEKLLKLIPEYGRWDDLISLICVDNGNVNRLIIDIIKEQLEKDLEAMAAGKECSLLAKWLPIENNTKNKHKKKLARFISSMLGLSSKKIRHIVSDLRQYLNIVEKNLSTRNYGNIEYSAVPSKASLIYRNAFKKNDSARYEDYISSLTKGETKINTGTLYPYELVNKIMKKHSYNFNFLDDDVVEQMWKNLPNYCGDNKKAICVVDVSGSMLSGFNEVSPISVALSLGLYFSERNVGPFKDHFITFSTNPSLVRIPEGTLANKFNSMCKADWLGCTDIQKVFNLILTSAVKNNLTQEDMPDTVYIISDMEFNTCGRNTNLEEIKLKYKKAGYLLPSLVFWNVNGRIGNSPATQYDENTCLVSGCSPSIFKYAISGQTPVDFMLEVLNSERYSKVTF